MNLRFSALVGLSVLLALPVAAQTVVPLSGGHPDLQGNWTNNTLTPLERPAEFAGKAAFSSEAEASAWSKKRNDAASDRREAVNDYEPAFFESGTELTRIDGVFRTSLVVDPPDGKIPAYTPEAQQRIAARRKEALLHPADGPESRSLSEQCLYWATAGPPMMSGPYLSNYQIVQTPGYVMIMSEMIHDVRIIPLDGRKHLPSNVRLWQGDSVGHWEGDTLVVDTTNFTDKTRFRNSDEYLHVVERFKRQDANSILYRFTVEDPTTFTKPWTVESTMTKAGSIYEYACHEGNYALRDILAGARADEAAGRPVNTSTNTLYPPPARPAQ